MSDRDFASRLGARVLAWIVAELEAAGAPTARDDAEFVLAEALGLSPAEVHAGAADDAFLTVDQLAAVAGLTARLAAFPS